MGISATDRELSLSPSDALAFLESPLDFALGEMMSAKDVLVEIPAQHDAFLEDGFFVLTRKRGQAGDGVEAAAVDPHFERAFLGGVPVNKVKSDAGAILMGIAGKAGVREDPTLDVAGIVGRGVADVSKARIDIEGNLDGAFVAGVSVEFAFDETGGLVFCSQNIDLMPHTRPLEDHAHLDIIALMGEQLPDEMLKREARRPQVEDRPLQPVATCARRRMLPQSPKRDVVDLARGHVAQVTRGDVRENLVDDGFSCAGSLEGRPQFFGVEGLGLAVGLDEVEGKVVAGRGHVANELISGRC